MYGGNVIGEFRGRKSKRNRNKKRVWDDDQTPRGYLCHTEEEEAQPHTILSIAASVFVV